MLAGLDVVDPDVAILARRQDVALAIVDLREEGVRTVGGASGLGLPHGQQSYHNHSYLKKTRKIWHEHSIKLATSK